MLGETGRCIGIVTEIIMQTSGYFHITSASYHLRQITKTQNGYRNTLFVPTYRLVRPKGSERSLFRRRPKTPSAFSCESSSDV